MKISIAICLLFGVWKTTHGQVNYLKKYADSLHVVIRQASNDTQRMDNLFRLSSYYIQSYRDSALKLNEQAMEIAKKIKQPLWVAHALNDKAFILMNQGNYLSAFNVVNEAMQLAKDEKNERNLYIPDNSGILPDARKFRMTLLIGGLHQLGNIHSSAGNKEKAIEYFQEEIQISAEHFNGSVGSVSSNMNIGSIYLTKGKLDSAFIYTSRAIAYADITGYKEDKGLMLRNMGTIFFRQNQLDSARHYYWQSIAESKVQNNVSNESQANISLAQLYEKGRQSDSVMYYAREALRGADILQSGTAKISALALIANAYQIKGNSDSAYYYLSLSKKLGDSLSADKIDKLTQFQNNGFEVQLNLEKAVQENIVYKNKIRTAGLIAGMGLFSFLALVFYRNNQKKHKANTVLQQTLLDLKSTQAQLVQSEKMASLGELTAGIAHEIQNPLNFVNNFSEVSNELVDEMKEEIKKGNYAEVNVLADDVKQNLEKIHHHGKRADAIVKGMLQHSQSSSGIKEPTDINALAEEYLRLAYHGLRAKDNAFNASFKTDFDPSIGKINIIPQEIGRVLLNLYNNAFYAVAERNKQIDHNYEPTVLISTKKITNKIEIRVSDNGNGIPQKIVDKIFQPFFTTKPAAQGTGLGLSLSYDIIKAHGGELKVETKEGEGSTFFIQIPTA
jgi:signal transduction histidine kinase